MATINRLQMSERFFEELPTEDKKKYAIEKERLEVARKIQLEVAPRPYTKSDFVRKEFHSNLVKPY